MSGWRAVFFRREEMPRRRVFEGWVVKGVSFVIGGRGSWVVELRRYEGAWED